MPEVKKTRKKKADGNTEKQPPERDPLVSVLVQVPASLRKRIRRASAELERYHRDLIIMAVDEYLEKLGF